MYLKIWVGPEMEGPDLGVNTLFIASNGKISYDKIQNFLSNDSLNIRKIYLGAGRQDFLGFDSQNSFIRFKEFTNKKDISVAIETTLENFNSLICYLDFCEIIVSIRKADVPVSSNIKLKIDDYKTARIFSNSIFYDTNLSDVSDERYLCDKILLDLEV